MSFKHPYELLFCELWVRHAYNIMINFGAGVENVTQKMGLYSLYGAFKHLSLWPETNTLSPDCGNCSQELAPNSVK